MRTRFAHIEELIAREPCADQSETGTAGWLARLCRAAVSELASSGVAVSLMDETGSLGVAAASDPRSALVVELQFTLGEGPCVDSFATRRPVLVPDLPGEPATRWPAYAGAVEAHGIRAVFAFPLQIGAARLGVLDVFRDHAGSLTLETLTQALSFAEVATKSLLEGQEAAGEGRTPSGLDDVLESRFEVYQAQGMVMIQLQVGLTQAMSRLRAHAFAHDRPLGDVARDVVARRLVLQRDST